MTITRIVRLAVAVMMALVACAAWLMPRHPIVAGAMLGAVALVGIAQWRSRAAARLIRDAGLRCDLDALTELATRGSVLGRINAIFAAIHHGGVTVATTDLCTCGECELDTIDSEIESVRRIVRLSWTGFGAKAYELSNARELIDTNVSPTYRDLVTQLRLVTRLVSYAAKAAEDEAKAERPEWFAIALTFVEQFVPAVVWPARLAAAREAASRNDRTATRQLLQGMPAWPEGSLLERTRAELATTAAS